MVLSLILLLLVGLLRSLALSSCLVRKLPDRLFMVYAPALPCNNRVLYRAFTLQLEIFWPEDTDAE